MGRLWTCILTLAGTILIGCGRPAGVIFPPLANPIVWPAPPERSRIRYVGQIATSADLKPAVPFHQQVGELLFGKAPVEPMSTPYALCTDGADRLFVADSNALVVHVFDLNSRQYSRWIPNNPRKQFGQPVGIAWDPGGRLFVADSTAGVIYVFDSRGKQTAIIAKGLVQRPCGLAFDARTNRLFVADAARHRVEVLSPEGGWLAGVGTRGDGPGQFNFPTNVALDSRGRLYVSDSLNFRIQQFGLDLRPLRQIGRKGDLPGYFSQPKGVALDTQDHLYVVDANFEAVQIFDDQGRLLLDFGQEGHDPGNFWLPSGIFIDPHNRIWIADCYNRRVQVFDFLPEASHE